MNRKLHMRSSEGFTLIELLIVVIIVAILAAVVIPQFNDTSREAKESTLDANLAAMRSAIELYKLQHNGVNPGASTAIATTCPSVTAPNTAVAGSADALKAQLTMPSNAKGETCDVADANFRYGPYLKTGVPAEPMSNSTAIAMKGDGKPIVPTATTPGWAMDHKSGQIVANSVELDSKGTKKYYEH